MKNVINWDSEWQYSQQLTDSLRKFEKNGTIHHLCFMPGGWACFRSGEPADRLLRNLSLQCEGKVISHRWLDGDNCGSALWQDGRESRYIPPLETPDWHSLTEEVAEKTETWEACAAFHKKLDSCWETYIAKLRELTINQLSEQATEIAAAALCYGELRNIYWQKTWIEYFNQVEDPLAEAQKAMLTMLSEETYRNFDAAMWGLMDQADLERGNNKEAAQEQSTQV